MADSQELPESTLVAASEHHLQKRVGPRVAATVPLEQRRAVEAPWNQHQGAFALRVS
jgi:hypothetical protein